MYEVDDRIFSMLQGANVMCCLCHLKWHNKLTAAMLLTTGLLNLGTATYDIGSWLYEKRKVRKKVEEKLRNKG